MAEIDMFAKAFWRVVAGPRRLAGLLIKGGLLGAGSILQYLLQLFRLVQSLGLALQQGGLFGGIFRRRWFGRRCAAAQGEQRQERRQHLESVTQGHDVGAHGGLLGFRRHGTGDDASVQQASDRIQRNDSIDSIFDQPAHIDRKSVV